MRTGNRGSQLRLSKFTRIASAQWAAISAAAALGITLGISSQSRAAAPSEETLGQLAMAEEFANGAVKAVDRPKVLPPMIRQSAALLRAACDECAFEPRFPRLLTEACVQLNDTDGAIESLQKYRSIQLPEIQNDEFAQVHLIDLYTAKRETLQDKIDYLSKLLGVNAVPAPVRSHVALQCSKLMRQKFDTKAADGMLDQALQLNPLNPEALQAEYVAAQASDSAQRRAAALVGLLKSNPAQPLVMGTLADELASAGQPDLAVTWYKRSFVLAQSLGLSLDPGRYLNYSAALYMMDQAKGADDAAKMLLAGQPSNIGAATIGVLAARQAIKPPPGGGAPADPSVVQHAREAALAALTAQLGTLHGQLHGVTGAATTQASTTQPADLVGDISADAPQVRDKKNAPDITSQDNAFCSGYASALADLIFYYAYFDPQPAIANKLLDDLRLLRPADDIELARLEGFTFLADGKRDEAKQKFTAVAEHDPLSKMGLLLMDQPSPANSAAAAKLVTDHPAGLLGAILLDGLRDRGGKPSPSADAVAVAAEAAGFPLKLLDMLERGQASNFYTIVARPLHASRDFDEPQLVRVTIKNSGDYDLSVGTDGAIRPDLWFDVALQGGKNPSFYGTAYDRIAGPLVLPAHHLDQPGTDQVVRVDTGPLAQFLESEPTLAFTLNFQVFTNPIGQQVGVAPGPGGYRQSFASVMERKAAPIVTAQDIQNLVNPVLNGRIDQKIHAIELLTTYVRGFRARVARSKAPAAPAAPAAAAEPANNDAGAGGLAPPPSAAPPAPAAEPKLTQAQIDGMQSLNGTFISTIQRALRDPSALVRYWAELKLAQLGDPEARQSTAKQMVQGKEWEERMLGLMLANDLPATQCKPVAESLKDDPARYIKEFAGATIELCDLATAAHPATKP